MGNLERPYKTTPGIPHSRNGGLTISPSWFEGRATDFHDGVSFCGEKFGKMTIIEPVLVLVSGKKTELWRGVCDCGKEIFRRLSNFIRGDHKSCGCERYKGKHAVLRKANPSEFVSWCCMIRRCLNVKHEKFKYYGGRGIKVCARWEDSFALFLSDMGKKPTPRHTIDRINCNGDYEPSNCRWATPKQQAKNKLKTGGRHV